MSREFKYGLIIAGAYIAWELVAFFTGLHAEQIGPGILIDQFTFVIPAVTLFYALKAERIANEGWLDLRQGVGLSFRIGMVGAVFSTLFMALYLTQINPAYPTRLTEYKREVYMEQQRAQHPNYTQEHLRDDAVAKWPETRAPELLLSYGLLRLSSALLLGLLMTMVWRKEKPRDFSEEPQGQDSAEDIEAETPAKSQNPSSRNGFHEGFFEK
jgi:hypothetical protein